MFKVPEWESDIPKPKSDFCKKVKNKKSGSQNVKSEPVLVLHPQKLNKKVIQNYESSSNNVKMKKKKNKKKFNNLKHTVTLNKTESNIEKKPKEQEVKINPPNIAKKTVQIENKSKLNIVKKSPKKRKYESSSSGLVNDGDDMPAKSKKTKFNDLSSTNEEAIVTKKNFKKEKLRKLLEKSKRTSINVSGNGNKLRERMLERLKAAQFRYLNEKLYTSSGEEAKEIFQADPQAFRTYHQGYQQQVKKWPVNPLDVIVKKIKKMPKSSVIADMGCGEGALSRRVAQQVHSFDLVAAAAGVVACDMARTPLPPAAVDVVVYCLALMGTDLTRYLLEASRVLKTGGQLLIAEVESRFEDVGAFTAAVERLGFRLRALDKDPSVFLFMQFVKARDAPAKKNKLPDIQLKPCLYKKR